MNVAKYCKTYLTLCVRDVKYWLQLVVVKVRVYRNLERKGSRCMSTQN